MASKMKIDLGLAPSSISSNSIKNQDSTATASRLLQENHDLHHMFFNGEGFHNHISHALLTLWALGASSANIQKIYELNKVFQRPQLPVDQTLCHDLLDETKFIEYMGDENYYKAFLDFFEHEIGEHGWQEVVQKYIFARDIRADAMLVRLFDSFLHPLIHLGFGVEFEQPAIIAEALAQTACHQNWIGELLLPAEISAKSCADHASIIEILDAFQNDPAILEAPRWTDHDKIRDGILGRAKDEMIQYLARINVDAKELPLKTAEMINAAAWFTAGAQRDGKAIKFDFYLLHSLTSSLFFSNFLDHAWLGDDNKARLLTWKIRADLLMYASRKSPRLDLEAIRGYQSNHDSSWEEIQHRVCSILDDGHASKLIRAVVHGREVCRPYHNEMAFRLKDGDWHRIALMAIDSVDIAGPDEEAKIQFDGPGRAWVRSAGFDEAWVDIPDRK